MAAQLGEEINVRRKLHTNASKFLVQTLLADACTTTRKKFLLVGSLVLAPPNAVDAHAVDRGRWRPRDNDRSVAS